MRNVTDACVSKSDLQYLFGAGQSSIRSWINQGLPQNLDGSFRLATVCRWLRQQAESELAAKLRTGRVNQNELSQLLGVTAVTVLNWRRAGLPAPKSGFRVGAVLRWLRGFYLSSAERKYERRLATMETKLLRNVRQLERFFERERKKINKLSPLFRKG